jgi:hypothetical protein
MSMPNGRSLTRDKVSITQKTHDEISISFNANFELPKVTSKKILIEETHNVVI